jgi:hypothetical protein
VIPQHKDITYSHNFTIKSTNLIQLNSLKSSQIKVTTTLKMEKRERQRLLHYLLEAERGEREKRPEQRVG